MESRRRGYPAEVRCEVLLLLFTAGTVCAGYLTGGPRLDVMGVALASGLTLAVVLTLSFHVSPGCLNPAVTLTLWVFKRLEGRRVLAMIVMQLLGAALAGLAVRFSFHAEKVPAPARRGA